MRTTLIALALVFSWAQSALAQTSADQTIEIQHPWARASTGKTGAAYLKIVSKGTSDDRLIAVSSPLAEKVELHTTIDDKGIMKMRPVDWVDVKAGGQAELKPGGIHVMLIGLKASLKTGQTFPVTLTFEKAGNVAATVTVEKAGAMRGHDMSGMHHNMPGME